MFNKLINSITGKYSKRIAICKGDEQYTFNYLESVSNKISNYLMDQNCANVAILINISYEVVISLLGVLKTSKSCIYINPKLTKKQISEIINKENVNLVISVKEHLALLNEMQWQCDSLETYLCLDSLNIFLEKETSNQLSNKKLWDYIGHSSKNEIEAGGWIDSYTRSSFSIAEMKEYASNIKEKILPLINTNSHVLEIGCSSGVTLFEIAPLVKNYMGIDISKCILKKTTESIKKRKLYNVSLKNLSAHQINLLTKENYNLVIINSVVHLFDGLNYLRNVLLKSVDLMSLNGHIFIGDVLDLKLKDEFIESLIQFKKNNPEKNTKLNFSNELFVSRNFFNDLKSTIPQIKNVKITPKIYSIENELTKYRYDVLLEIDKRNNLSSSDNRIKYQHDLKFLNRYSDTLQLGIEEIKNSFKIYEINSNQPIICKYEDLVKKIINNESNNTSSIGKLLVNLLSLKCPIIPG